MAFRRANFAGSWYSDSPQELSDSLTFWLNQAVCETARPARAIVAPHAGYQYCGACAAHAYKQIDAPSIKRIFVLGPSHRVRLGGCALTSVAKYQTPFYDLDIDLEINKELEMTGYFDSMDLTVDENEHSIEMQLPFIAKVMENRQGQFKVIPVLVGSLTPEKEARYGKIFAHYLASPDNLFVISSDFCHWGQKFGFTYHEKSQGALYQSIEWLDRLGMDIIETLDPSEFTNYLVTYGNTICGRHPIGVLLQAVQHLKDCAVSLKFLAYAQSNQCRNIKDSSVSYAAASLVVN